MKLLAHTVVVVLFAASSAFAADCAVTAKDLKPQFAAKLPSGFKLVSTKADKKAKTLRQELTVPGGLTVTVELGGCERLKYAFLIKGPTLTTKTVGAEVLAVSKRVLPSLPMASDALADPARLAKALDDAQIVSLPSAIPCGDADCKVALEEDPKAKPKTKAKPRPKPKKGKDGKDEKPAEEPVPESSEGVPALLRISWEAPAL